MDAWMNKWMNECRNGRTNGMTCMVVKPNWFSLFVLKRKIKKKRFDKSQSWYLVNIFSLDIRNKSFSWYLWPVSGIRRVRLKQILLESRQICWNTFLRYALYNVDSTIIWLLVDMCLHEILRVLKRVWMGLTDQWQRVKNITDYRQNE